MKLKPNNQKQLYLLIILFVSLFNSAKAQGYIQLINDSAIWNCLSVVSNGPSSANFYPYTRVLQKDSILNGITYKVDNYSPSSFYREDSAHNQVYGRTLVLDSTGSFVLSDELLIYDFNLQVGDTFKVAGIQQMFDTIVLHVSFIDSVIDLDGNYRKRISLSIIDQLGLMKTMTWIEGIGAIDFDLFYPRDLSIYDFHTLNTVYCYQKNNQPVFEYPYDYWSSSPSVHYNCGTITNIGQIEEKNNELQFFPNPVQNELTIQLIAETQKVLSIQVFDLLGKEQGIKWQKTSLSNAKMNTSTLSQGVYLLNVRTEQGIITKKIIKN
jgi:hypothetical protein